MGPYLDDVMLASLRRVVYWL